MKQLFLPFIRVIHSKIYDANYIPDLLDLVVAVHPSVKNIAPGIYTQDAVLYMDEVIRKGNIRDSWPGCHRVYAQTHLLESIFGWRLHLRGSHGYDCYRHG